MHYPAMIDIGLFNIIIIGGGKIAYQKAKELQNYGGKIKLISPELSSYFNELSQPFEYMEAVYSEKELNGATLVIAATNNKKVNDEIGYYCRRKHILCNVVTNLQLSSFIVPASVKRGNLVISVSTQGKCPALAKRIKEKLEVEYGQEYGSYIELLGIAREKIKCEVENEQERKQLIKKLLSMSEEELRMLNKGENHTNLTHKK